MHTIKCVQMTRTRSANSVLGTLPAASLDAWRVAGGSVIGSAHRRSDRPNQDAWVVARRERALVGVVADGCGSAPHSEVGAWLVEGFDGPRPFDRLEHQPEGLAKRVSIASGAAAALESDLPGQRPLEQQVGPDATRLELHPERGRRFFPIVPQ